MTALTSPSTFELLPDEILLEVCRCLLCSDVLYSFNGLNSRITRMIFRYRQHVTLERTSVAKCDYLCSNVFPVIGSQIRSLVIDCCYSLLQDQLFLQYFASNMSVIFPNLERVSLVSFKYQPLVAFLRSLHDLPHLVEIRLDDLFILEEPHQADGIRTIAQANNHRLTRISVDQRSCSFSFDRVFQYLNVRQLRVNLKSMAHLPSLFATVPNVHLLEVTVEQRPLLFEYLDGSSLSALVHLTHFQLVAQLRIWQPTEWNALLVHMPVLEHLSIVLMSSDRYFVEGDTMLDSLPDTVRQFNYGVHFFDETAFDEVDDIIASWPPSHPVACLDIKEALFLHTLPWTFDQLHCLTYLSRKTSSCAHNLVNCYEKVEQLTLRVNQTFTLTKSLAMISQCRRAKDVAVCIECTATLAKEVPQPLPRLSRLTEFCLFGALPSDLSCFSLVLDAAPNLFSLDISFELVMHLINDPPSNRLLGQRITSLSIRENTWFSLAVSFGTQHIPITASTFPRLTDLYVVASHPSVGVITTANKDAESHATVSRNSLIPPLLVEFQHHKLISLSVSEAFDEAVETDPEQWLHDNTVLCDHKFRAKFFRELNRLDIWM